MVVNTIINTWNIRFGIFKYVFAYLITIKHVFCGIHFSFLIYWWFVEKIQSSHVRKKHNRNWDKHLAFGFAKLSSNTPTSFKQLSWLSHRWRTAQENNIIRLSVGSIYSVWLEKNSEKLPSRGTLHFEWYIFLGKKINFIWISPYYPQKGIKFAANLVKTIGRDHLNWARSDFVFLKVKKSAKNIQKIE